MLGKFLIVSIVLSCAVVDASPLGREGEIGDTCHGDYCSMFEGICKNGGTCISKGCKGECKCTSEFSGHNCEVPNTPVTTLAPKKTVKKKQNTKKKDLGLILSLFRILQNRPETQQVEKNEAKSKSEKNKDGDTSFGTDENKRKDNFPSRPEPGKQAEHDKNKGKEVDRKAQEPVKQNDSKTTQPTAVLISNTDKHSTMMPSVDNKKIDKTNKAEKLIVDKTKYPSLSNQRHVQIRTRKPRQQSPVATSTVSFQTNPHRKISPTFIHQTREQFQPNVFRAPIQMKFTPGSTIASKSILEQKIKEHMDMTTTAFIPLTKIANVGHKLLSSTTLSNLYLSHTLLSKSRIFVSTVPNKTFKTKPGMGDISAAFVKNEIMTPSTKIVERTTKAYVEGTIDDSQVKNKGSNNKFGNVLLKTPLELQIDVGETTVQPASSTITQNILSRAPPGRNENSGTIKTPPSDTILTSGNNKNKKVTFRSNPSLIDKNNGQIE